jgi:Rieske Fe-S protein
VPVQPMTRRSALTGAAAVAAGAVAGYLLGRNSDAARAAAPGTAANAYGPAKQATTVLAKASEVRGAGVVAHGVVLTRDGSGTVHGVSAVCTHQGCTVSSPHDGVVNCPCHGSRFDASTGKVLRGPATRPLPAVPVSVQGDDVVRG